MLYWIECWAIKSRQKIKLNVTEIRMLEWMRGHIRLVIGLEMKAVAPTVKKWNLSLSLNE